MAATVLKAQSYGTQFNAPEGFLTNGKIVPSATTVTATLDKNLGTTANDAGFETNYWRAQPFTPSAGVVSLNSVKLGLKKTGSPTGNLTVEIQSDTANAPSGSVLYTTTIDSATLTTSYAQYTIIPNISVTAGTKYHVCLKGQAAWAAGTDVVWGYASGAGLAQYNFGAGNFSSNATTVEHDVETYYSYSTLTLTLQTLDGNTPTPANSIFIRIGDVVRSITSALTWSLGSGTNWANSGSAELATKEIDYFIYAGWNTTNSAVQILMSRIPYATLYSDFNYTATNEKTVFGYANATGSDSLVNIGRFAATLSAQINGYTWTVPTFTAANLIQRPIYETRWLTIAPVITTTNVDNGTGSTQPTIGYARYMITGNRVIMKMECTNAVKNGAGDYIQWTNDFPITPSANYTNNEALGVVTSDLAASKSGTAVFSQSTGYAYLLWNANVADNGALANLCMSFDYEI
jgi:hypothetical protein